MRLPQARQAILARLLESQGLEQQGLDPFTPPPHPAGQFVESGCRGQQFAPAALRQQHISACDAGMQAQFRRQQAVGIMEARGNHLLEPAPEHLAGLRPALQRMQPDLLAKGDHAEARDSPFIAERVQRLEQIMAAVHLPGQSGQPGRRDESVDDGIGTGQPFDHIQAVRQYGSRLAEFIPLQQHRRQ
ncbi:hypothetical protein D9M72_440800 [compost metagenome]